MWYYTAPKGALTMFQGIKCQTITEFLRLSEYRKNVRNEY